MCCEARSRATAVSYASVRPGFQKTRAGHGQENAPPRTAGMGAVTLTGHPVFPPQACDGAGSAPPGVMTQVSGTWLPQTGSLCGTDGVVRPTSAPPSPAVIQVTVVGYGAARPQLAGRPQTQST